MDQKQGGATDSSVQNIYIYKRWGDVEKIFIFYFDSFYVFNIDGLL